jgi:hypothetical protein
MPMLDIVMIALLLAAFAGAEFYVQACRSLGTAWQPPGRDVP